MTISRTGWSTILVDSCKPLIAVATLLYTSGSATGVYNNGNLVLNAALAGDAVGFTTEVAAGVDNTFEFNVGKITSAAEQGVLVTVLETIDNVQYVIGGGRLLPGRQKVNFRSTGNNVSLLLTGPFQGLEIMMICTKYPKSVQHTYLVDVCDESKDRYRFGAQEKDNEIAGVGNHYEYKYRRYDPRTGRFFSVDPLHSKYSWNSTYAFAENDVIRAIDLEGLEKVIITENYPANSEYIRTAKFNENESEWNVSDYGYVDAQTNNMTLTNTPKTKQDQRWFNDLRDKKNLDRYDKYKDKKISGYKDFTSEYKHPRRRFDPIKIPDVPGSKAVSNIELPFKINTNFFEDLDVNQINAYLTPLAAALKGDPKMQVKVIGQSPLKKDEHIPFARFGKSEDDNKTDFSVSGAEIMYWRAEKIKEILVEQGVSASQITTEIGSGGHKNYSATVEVSK